MERGRGLGTSGLIISDFNRYSSGTVVIIRLGPNLIWVFRFVTH
jgi:hypothetical protein